MRTKEEYIEKLGKMNRNLYSNGEKIDRLDERQQGAINVIGLTFDAHGTQVKIFALPLHTLPAKL